MDCTYPWTWRLVLDGLFFAHLAAVEPAASSAPLYTVSFRIAVQGALIYSAAQTPQVSSADLSAPDGFTYSVWQ